MATDRHCVKTYLNVDEKAQLDSMCAQMKLSSSELLRRLLTNRHLPSAADFAASEGILKLLEVNADQARLGNLLKLMLDEPLSEDVLRKFEELTNDIRSTQDELKATVRMIDANIKPVRR
ncbi:conjugal transfer protein TraJ [Candidatus Kaiserbacteria bacterium]|nr:MAG: conjugal transfer protein TraJ [Candidatus Kaiserbacteria bacterium]